LFGTLLAMLFGLLVLGGSVVLGKRRARRAAVAVNEELPPDEERAPPSPSTTRRRSLPSIAAPACAPRRGWACWRGRLALSPAIRAAWRARRAAQRTEVAAANSEQIHVDSEVTAIDVTTDSGPKPSSGAAGDDVPLPPEGSFQTFFDLRVEPLDDPTATATATPTATPPIVTLAADGAFEIQVAPGRYTVEVASNDDLLVAGLDGAVAVAGDTPTDIELALSLSVAITGRVIDEDGIALATSASLQRLDGADVATGSVSASDGFRFDGLRAGTFRLTTLAEDGRSIETIVRAPVAGLELRLDRPRDALLIFAPPKAGNCPVGRAILVQQKPAGHPQKRVLSVSNCRSVVTAVPPGSSWDLFVMRQSTWASQPVRFGFDQPLVPVCADEPCDTNAAALDVWVVDSAGHRRLPASFRVETAPDGDTWGVGFGHLLEGLPANQGVTLTVELDGAEATSTLWLRPGVNRANIHLPIAAGPGDEAEMVDVVTVE
jgi:hypothetical protein